MDSTKKLFANGVVWNFVDSISSQLISFIVSIILARILIPSDFGTIALVFVFIGFAQVFSSGSLNDAIIVLHRSSDLALNSVFYYNLVSSIAVYLLLYLTSPIIALFFSIPELEQIIRVIGLTVIINSSNLVHVTLLYRDVNFRLSFYLKIPGLVISSISGILMAYNGYGVWALVIQNLFLNIINSLVFWFSGIWYPKRMFSYKELKVLFDFGGKMLIANLINKLFESLYPLFIGKTYTSAILGYYNRGVSIKDLLVNNIVQVVAKVSLPVFSKLIHDTEYLKRAYKKIMQVTFYIITPIMLGGIAVSHNLIVTVYSAKWLMAVPFFQLACILGVLYPFHYINIDILKVYSKSTLILKLEIIKKTLIVCAIFITFKYGIVGIMIGQIAVSLVALLLNSFYSGILINYGLLKQFSDLTGVFVVSVLMAGFVFFIGELLPFSEPLLLLFQLVTGCVVYLVISYLFKIAPFVYLKEILQLKLKK